MEMKEFHYEDGLRVSVFNLDHKSVPYHWHSAVSDTIYCARGQITVELPDVRQFYRLDPGQVFQVPNPTRHRFVNSAPAGTTARYVLLQIGTFDIHFTPDEELSRRLAGHTAAPVESGPVYIEDRKREIAELAGRFERQRPETLTGEERDDVVAALRLLASSGLPERHPRAAATADPTT